MLKLQERDYCKIEYDDNDGYQNNNNDNQKYLKLSKLCLS